MVFSVGLLGVALTVGGQAASFDRLPPTSRLDVCELVP